MAGPSMASRLWRASRRALHVSYWRRELSTGRVLKPAYVSLMLRWCTWLIALLMTASGFLMPENTLWSRPLLVVTGIWLLVQVLYLPILRFAFPPPARRRWLAGHRVVHMLDRGAALSAFEVLAAGVVLMLTGGWGSPFYLYGLSSIVMPALLFGYRAALLAGAGFSLLFALSVAVAERGLESIVVPGLGDGFIGYVLIPIPFALFAAYLGRVTRQLETEAIRRRRALTETQVLQAVTAGGLRHVDDAAGFVAETVGLVRRRVRPRAFAIVYRVPRHGEDGTGGDEPPNEAVAGFARAGGAIAAVLRGAPAPLNVPTLLTLPLAQGDRHLGWLYAETATPLARRPFMQALAGQVSAALANAHLHAETQALAARAERARLAREIHDGIAQSLFMLTLNLEACAELAARDPAQLPARLELLTGVARQALWQTRHYLHSIKPMLHEDQPLGAAIEGQIREFRAVSGLGVTLSMNGDEGRLTPTLKQAVYRIAQEGLANVFKHARARRVEVNLTFDSDGLTLVIEDDGQGFELAEDDRAAHAGFGLQNMRARAEELGGRLAIESRPEDGTTLRAWMPRAPAARPLSALGGHQGRGVR